VLKRRKSKIFSVQKAKFNGKRLTNGQISSFIKEKYVS